jgi:CheY-like chemotaxis protein/predicted regulator of Ras-like GTPase activity (Roadblock/LC7/MglB family)
MHLLVVDPNVAFGTLLRDELVRLGHRVDVCSSGTTALSLAASDPPDLALLDMGLASPNALVLGERLRGLRRDVRLMLIPLMGEAPALTANAPAIQGVLPKPFFLPELADRIGAAMAAPPDEMGEGVLTGASPDDERALGGDEPVTPKAVRDDADAPEGADLGAGGSDAVDLLMDDASVDADLDWLTALEPLADGGENENETTGTDAGASIAPVGAEGTAPVSVASEAKMASGISRPAFRMNQGRIEALMADLVSEVGADEVILTCDVGLLTAVGGLQEDEIASISEAVLSGFRASAEMARVLGREQLRFEQSIAGGSYLLYALGIEDAILAVTVRGDAPLGLLRHRARITAERIADLCR